MTSEARIDPAHRGRSPGRATGGAIARRLSRAAASLAIALAVLAAPATPSAHAQGLPMPAHTTVTSREYEIVTDLPRDQIRSIAAHMDAVARAYRQMFSGFDTRSTTPTRLYLWSTRERYIQHGASMGSDWTPSGGVFFRNASGSGVSTWINDQPSAWLTSLLQHEGFHQFAHKHLGPTLPLWANEGLAVYFEHALLVRGELVQGITPKHRIDLLRQAIENDRHFPVQELMAITSQGWWEVMRGGDGRAGIMYTQAWSLAHFLIHADNGRYKGAFEDYLREIARGSDHANAFRAAFRTDDTAAFERRWLAYALALEPDPIGEATQRLQFMATGVLWLRSAGVMTTGIADLKHELQRRNYRTTRVIDGVPHTTNATDEMFEPPTMPERTRARRSAQPTLEALPIQPARDGEQLPPALVIRGLRVTVGVQWVHAHDGQLTFEIVYE